MFFLGRDELIGKSQLATELLGRWRRRKKAVGAPFDEQVAAGESVERPADSVGRLEEADQGAGMVLPKVVRGRQAADAAPYDCDAQWLGRPIFQDALRLSVRFADSKRHFVQLAENRSYQTFRLDRQGQ